MRRADLREVLWSAFKAQSVEPKGSPSLQLNRLQRVEEGAEPSGPDLHLQLARNVPSGSVTPGSSSTSRDG